VTVNVILCRQVLDWATTHPEHHLQSDWLSFRETPGRVSEVRLNGETTLTECGTTACCAGITAALTVPEGTRYQRGTALMVFPGGAVHSIADWAHDQLGLPDGSLSLFFFADEQLVLARLAYLADHPDAVYEDIEAVRSVTA
jgi:hypothetical protein